MHKMRPSSVLLACALLVAIGIAYAQPCIECQDCKGSSNCLKMCEHKCEKTVDLEKCKRAGREAGLRVAKESCDLTLLYCRGGQKPQPRAAALRVDLKQCGNAAFGECQRIAKDAKQSPCGASFDGKDQCDATAFQAFYNGEVDERCGKAADAVEKNGP